LSPPCRPPRSALFPYTTLFRSRVELLGQRFEVPAQAPDSVAGLIGDAEVDAQEQTLRVLVIELLELLDVTAVGEQCAGHRVEDAGAFVAFEGEDVVLHCCVFLFGRALSAVSQHSMTLTASPPRDVSLYFDFISAPVCRMVSIA